MKRKIHIAVSALCLLWATSCEVEFDFRGLDSDPLFLIDGYVKTDPSEPGTGSFQMYLYGVPSAAGTREFDEDARCTLKIYRNSELIDTKDYITIKDFYGLIADNYPADAGDEFTVTAESGGFLTASSSAVIPRKPAEVQASGSIDGDNLRIRLSITDNAGSDDAYAVCFLTESSFTRPDDNYHGTWLELTFGNTPESSFMDIGPFDVSWEDGFRYYGIYDDSFEGGRKEFEVTAPLPAIEAGKKLYLRVEVQSVSPERLRYETACIDKANNALGFIGLAPVTFAYTNVAGGAGCFSGGYSFFTDWTPVTGQ